MFASVPHDSPPPPPTNRKPGVRRMNNAPVPPPKLRQQPSVAEIERAIGAGLFRDRNPRESEQNKTLFDELLSNSIGKPEGSMEKKLRETGAWMVDQTEGASRSAGKKLLMVVFKWILPIWVLLFLVAYGIIKLPFSTPFLDDLIM